MMMVMVMVMVTFTTMIVIHRYSAIRRVRCASSMAVDLVPKSSCVKTAAALMIFSEKWLRQAVNRDITSHSALYCSRNVWGHITISMMIVLIHRSYIISMMSHKIVLSDGSLSSASKSQQRLLRYSKKNALAPSSNEEMRCDDGFHHISQTTSSVEMAHESWYVHEAWASMRRFRMQWDQACRWRRTWWNSAFYHEQCAMDDWWQYHIIWVEEAALSDPPVGMFSLI